MIDKAAFADLIETLCPSDTAEAWDNCGFQINGMKQDIDKVLVALEITEAVIDEAQEKGVQLILTHHPLLFSAVKSIDYGEPAGRFLFRLIQKDISVYSCHTSFDRLQGGNNDYFGQLLGFTAVRSFTADNGFCRKGEIRPAMTLKELAGRLSAILNIEKSELRCVGDPQKLLRTAGWCTGAGSEFITDAVREGCDVFITGDLKYHEAQAAKETGICLLDAGHYGSEKIFSRNMAEMLREKSGGRFSVLESEKDLNPFCPAAEL